MSLPDIRVAAIAALALTALPVWSADHTVALRRLQFQPDELHLKVGDSITFRNDDQVAHDLTATSPGSGFEDVSVDGGASVHVAFAKPGEVVLGCSLHDGMALKVVVEP